jgi:phosphomannomutase
MALIKSISGIRGTIGNKPGENLTPVDIVKFTASFATVIKGQKDRIRMVVGRDGRISGPMVQQLVISTLVAMGIEVIDLGLSTTPTVEMAVTAAGADGGIIITASHNPREWNALKLLNERGEFIDATLGALVLSLAEQEEFSFALVDKLGSVSTADYKEYHLDAILQYPLVDAQRIAEKKYKVVVDAINSTGALYVPALLQRLGVQEVIVLNKEVNGQFAHSPEPLPENLQSLCQEVVRQGADLGIAVDPDVDRLCFVNEDGTLFGEEYTLVAVADYVLSKRPGYTVSNLSSTKSLKELSLAKGGNYASAAVGEVNVVAKMKEVQAVIGGEGNGGVIVPDFHYGRDALIGIALFMTHLATSGKKSSQFRKQYPDYVISKNKIELAPGTQLAAIFDSISKKYAQHPQYTEDGLKIEFGNDWVHLRSSNTEPIIRIYAESDLEDKAAALAQQLMQDINEFSN